MSPLVQSRNMRRLQAVRTQKQSRAVALAREALVTAEHSVAQAEGQHNEAIAQEGEARAALRGKQCQGAASPLQILALIEQLEHAQHRCQLAEHQSKEMRARLVEAVAHLNSCQRDWRLQQQREDRWADQCERLLAEWMTQRDDAEEEALEEDLSARLGAGSRV